VLSPDGRLAVPVGFDDHSIGRVDAEITLVEYGDFECPRCAQAAGAARELRGRFVDEVRFVFRNLPMARIHPHAERAAEAAEAAAVEDRFWEMHDLLFEHQSDLSDESLLRYAAHSGADPAAVAEALRLGTMRARVERDATGGIRSGVTCAPAFFINSVRYPESDLVESFTFRSCLDKLTQAVEARVGGEVRRTL
jgi:protein-disulfide isomerase